MPDVMNIDFLSFLLKLHPIQVFFAVSVAIIFTTVASIAYYIPNYIKNKLNSKLINQYSENYNIFILAEVEIKKILKQMLNRLNCDRALVAEYHNGEMNIANISRLKVSIKLEEVQPGIDVTLQDIQSVPSSFYSEWTDALLEEKTIKIPNTDSLQFGNSPHLYKFVAINHRVKSIYLLPIKDKNLNLFAAGLVEFVNEEHVLNDKDLSYLCFSFGKISSILDATVKIKHGQQG